MVFFDYKNSTIIKISTTIKLINIFTNEINFNSNFNHNYDISSDDINKNSKQMTCPFSNHYNYTKEDLDNLLMYKHYINGWLSLFIILAGIIANSVTICALLHRYMRKSSTNAYLLALSSSNLFSLICLFLMAGLRFTLVHPYRLIYCKHWYENFISVSIPYLTPINQLFQLSGIYLIMAVSIDRYILVKNHVKPTETNRKKRRLITWIVILSIFTFCFLFTLPNWFVYTSKSIELNLTESAAIEKNFLKHPSSLSLPPAPTLASENKIFSLKEIKNTNNSNNNNNNNKHQHHIINRNNNYSHHYNLNNQNQSSISVYKVIHFKTEHTVFGRNDNVKALLSIYLYIPFVFGIPIIILLVINFLIIYELIKIGDRKRQLGAAAKIDRNITIMLVTIVIVFLICQVPLTLSHIFLAYNPEMMFERAFFIYNSFTNFLTCVYLSANFALFCFFGQAFRDTIQFMFCIRKDLPDQPKRPSIIFNIDYSRRATMFHTMFHSMIGARRNSALDPNDMSTKSRNRRKSLPAINIQKSMNKILEDEEQIDANLINDNNEKNYKPIKTNNKRPSFKTHRNQRYFNSTQNNNNNNQEEKNANCINSSNTNGNHVGANNKSNRKSINKNYKRRYSELPLKFNLKF